ncbi:MAG: hypothetical protein ABI878_02265, partial [Acidobacteriota bacterium]
MEFKHLASSYSKYLIITVAVVLALFVFEVLSFPKYYESYNLIPQIESGVFIGPLKTFFLGSISVLVFGTFVFASFVSEYRYRIVFLVLFSLGALTEYGYQAAYSHFTVS